MSEKEKETSVPADVNDYSEITSLVQESNNLVKNFKDRLDSFEAQIRDGKIPALANSTDKATAKKAELNKALHHILNKHNAGIPLVNSPDYIKNAFLSETSQGTDVSGHIVPAEMYNQILALAIQGGVMLRDAFQIPMKRKTLTVPKAIANPTFSFEEEGVKKSVSNPTFDSITLTRHNGGFIVLLSRDLIEDNDFDLVSFITMLSSQVYARVIDTYGFAGASTILGLTNAATLTTDRILTAGHTNFSDVNYDDILKMVGGLDDANNPNPKWYMNRSIYYGAVRTLKAPNSKEYIINPIDARDQMLESYKTEFIPDMPALSLEEANPPTSAGKKFMFLGDFKRMVFLGIRHSLGISYSDIASVGSGDNIVNLWEQGLAGIKIDASFDIKFPFPEKILAMKTASE